MLAWAMILFFSISSVVGVVLGLILWQVFRYQFIKRTNEEAADLVREAQDQFELEEMERTQKIQDIEVEAWAKSEKELTGFEERIEDQEDIIKQKLQKLNSQTQSIDAKFRNQKEVLEKEEQRVRSHSQSVDSLKNKILENENSFIDKLIEKTTLSKPTIVEEIIQGQEKQLQDRMRNWLEEVTEMFNESSESKAKQILDRILNRFARPYCPERGIGGVYFENPNDKLNLCDEKGANIQAIQDACGCDIIIEEGSEQIGIAGFDPVRRELTRRTLEKVLGLNKRLTPELIKRHAEQQQQDLFKQIREDGDAIAREMKLTNMHPEIKKMMGSLRFRYSFTQNQYFHCGEVGWLCGLLAAEVRGEIAQARRSGMLHDIGKSMDHAMEGGHAVIGANFIGARGEHVDVVHNVRAHHFDEQPNSDTAFLVIAADAVSGARPGARRSTAQSYTQKISEFQEIARSFEGVTDCIVLSGGRECRVYVNSRQVDDLKALELSKKIAHQIEDQCNYPGQIKVVVVRDTLIQELTNSRAASH